MRIKPTRQPLPCLARGDRVVYREKVCRVLRTLPGNRLDLEANSGSWRMRETFRGIHAGPGGWSPMPEEDPPSPPGFEPGGDQPDDSILDGPIARRELMPDTTAASSTANYQQIPSFRKHPAGLGRGGLEHRGIDTGETRQKSDT
jgi:hypothetical protein